MVESPTYYSRLFLSWLKDLLKYINYDLDLIKREYERVSETIMEMQMALDLYNQTVLFDVEI